VNAGVNAAAAVMSAMCTVGGVAVAVGGVAAFWVARLWAGRDLSPGFSGAGRGRTRVSTLSGGSEVDASGVGVWKAMLRR
jgi:hypothetical protein